MEDMRPLSIGILSQRVWEPIERTGTRIAIRTTAPRDGDDFDGGGLVIRTPTFAFFRVPWGHDNEPERRKIDPDEVWLGGARDFGIGNLHGGTTPQANFRARAVDA